MSNYVDITNALEEVQPIMDKIFSPKTGQDYVDGMKLIQELLASGSKERITAFCFDSWTCGIDLFEYLIKEYGHKADDAEIINTYLKSYKDTLAINLIAWTIEYKRHESETLDGLAYTINKLNHREDRAYKLWAVHFFDMFSKALEVNTSVLMQRVAQRR
jgi:hypothetical protein